MAGRKSTASIKAQRKALEAAQKFQQQQERLLALAEEFFTLPETTGIAALEDKISEYREKISELEEQISAKESELSSQQADVILRMQEEGINATEVAERLDISSAEVRKLSKLKKQEHQQEEAE